MKKRTFKAPTIKLTRAGVLFLFLLLVGGWTLFATLASLAQQEDGREPPPKRRILFVHIGKTGGETLKAQLQVSCKTRKNPTIRSACQERFQNAAAAAAATTPNDLPSQNSESISTATSLVSEQTVGYFHINTLYPRNAIPLATNYLFTLRNPISRVVSWYAYNHPKSCDRARDDLSPSCQLQEQKRGSTWGQGFFRCFDTMNDFAVATRGMGAAHNNQNGTSRTSTKARLDASKSECQALAWRALIGDAPEKELNHLLWNHRYYMDRTMGVSNQKQILVIRTEFLKQDFMELNEWLATGARSRSTIKRNIPRMVWMEPNPEHSAEQHPVKDGVIDKRITSLGLFHLCCALLDELDIYSFLIQGAGNLSPEAKQQSLQTLTSQCGKEETRRRDCANASTP